MEMNCAMCVIRGRSAQRLHTEAGTNICHHCQLTHSSMEVFIFKLLTTLSTETASHTALAILPPLTWYDKKKKRKILYSASRTMAATVKRAAWRAAMKSSSPNTMDSPPCWEEEVTRGPLTVTNAAFCYLNWGVSNNPMLPICPSLSSHLLIRCELNDKKNHEQSWTLRWCCLQVWLCHFPISLSTYF